MLLWLPSICGFACWLLLLGRRSQLSVQAQYASYDLAAPARKVAERAGACGCLCVVRACVSGLVLSDPSGWTHLVHTCTHHALPRSIDRSCHGNLQLGARKAHTKQNRSQFFGTSNAKSPKTYLMIREFSLSLKCKSSHGHNITMRVGS